MANNIGQKFSAGKAEMLKLIKEQQEKARETQQLKGVTDAGARRVREYNKQIANLKATHAKMTEGKYSRRCIFKSNEWFE